MTIMNRKSKVLTNLATIAIAMVILGLSSCVSIPQGAKAVKPFDKQKYLGTWYEIARMDFKFERGLEQVSATYSLKDENTIRVDNKGYSTKDQQYKESIGKAKLVGDPLEGRLKVSFFGPFYGGYNVLAVDPDYRYALVAGNNLDYLWLLSREKTMPQQFKDKYLGIARSLGYRTEKLVWTKQNK